MKYLALAWNSRSPRRNTHVALEKGEEEAKRNNKSTASEFQPYGSPLYIYISRTGDIFRTRPIYLFYSGAERGLEVALPRHGTPPKIKFSLRGASSRVKLCISLGISLPYLSLHRLGPYLRGIFPFISLDGRHGMPCRGGRLVRIRKSRIK